MKKIIVGLLLLIGGVLFLINYLMNVANTSTDKVTSNALSKLIATGNNKPPAPAKTKPSVTEQVTKAITPLVNQATDTLNSSLTTPKPPIVTIKIYDKKTATETIIETPTQLQAQHQSLSAQQLDEQKDKASKFEAYYKKPEKCKSPSSHEIRIQCGNEYMRAKVKFAELYQQGKL